MAQSLVQTTKPLEKQRKLANTKLQGSMARLMSLRLQYRQTPKQLNLIHLQ